MKKIYIQPSIKVHNVKISTILAGSTQTTITDEKPVTTPSGMGAKGSAWTDLDDEDF